MSESEGGRCPLDITVAIPTYNGAKRIPQLLERLKAQTKVDGLQWEVLIVDNNSQDNTAEIVQQYQSHWLPEVPLRYYFEARQGAAFARQSAVQKAAGQLIGFLDDDNLPDETWVSEAYALSQQYPQAGAYSGQIHGEYEVPPPKGFEKIRPFLAIREHGSKPFQFQPESLNLPPAAALVVRREAWLNAVPLEQKFTGPGRKGQNARSYVGGEDYEALLYLHKAGWEIWYTPSLSTWHQIPASRFEKQYLLNLARGCGLTTYQLLLIMASDWQKPLLFWRTLLGGTRRVILHFMNHRKVLEKDLVAAFLMEFYIGGLLSPFMRKL